jgi:hypothetical protein
LRFFDWSSVAVITATPSSTALRSSACSARPQTLLVLLLSASVFIAVYG